MNPSTNQASHLLEFTYGVEIQSDHPVSSTVEYAGLTAAPTNAVPNHQAFPDSRGAPSSTETGTLPINPKISAIAKHSHPLPYDVPGMIDEYYSHAPYPHDGSWPENEAGTERFPEFVDDFCEQIEDIEAHKAYTSHCIIHCEHNVCRKSRYIDRTRYVSRDCRCFPIGGKLLSEIAPKELDERFQERITRLLRSDVKEAEGMYNKTYKDHIITVELQSAKALMKRLREMNMLDIERHMLGSRHYTPTLLKNPKHFTDAASGTSTIIDGIASYIARSLLTLPSQARSVSLADLETEIMNCAQWDIIDWMCKWVWKPKKNRELKANPTALRGATEATEGISVFCQRVRDRVGVLVAVLAWWDGEVSRGR